LYYKKEEEMNYPSKGIMTYLKVVAEFGRAMKKKKGWVYGSVEEFLAVNGRSFEESILGGSGEVEMGEKQMCYRNAFNLAVENPAFTYCEGYAVADKVPIPLMHAWTVTEGGNVVDPTWKHGVAYFGVKLPIWYVHRVIFKTMKWGVLDSWTIQWPLLTGVHPWPLSAHSYHLDWNVRR
jgi:hypothetical protein